MTNQVGLVHGGTVPDISPYPEVIFPLSIFTPVFPYLIIIQFLHHILHPYQASLIENGGEAIKSSKW
jgi:hypothetical protein